MKITRKNAFQIWYSLYGDVLFAEDFSGALMYRDAYGDLDYYITYQGRHMYCGWNIHHILPSANGGTDSINNLTCTNIRTNEIAGNRITFWIDDRLYQVKSIKGTRRHEIIRLK